MKQSVCSHPATKFFHYYFIDRTKITLNQFTHNSFCIEPVYPRWEYYNLCSHGIPTRYQIHCCIYCQIDGKVSSIDSNGFQQHRQYVIMQLNQQIGKQKLIQNTKCRGIRALFPWLFIKLINLKIKQIKLRNIAELLELLDIYQPNSFELIIELETQLDKRLQTNISSHVAPFSYTNVPSCFLLKFTF